TVLIGNIRSKPTGTRAYTRLGMIWDAGFQMGCPDRIMVPEPIGFFPDGGLWLQRKVPGRVSSDLLPTEKGVDLVQQIASASHKLHQANISTTRTHTMSDELRILHEKLLLVSQQEKSFSGAIDRILEASAKLGSSVENSFPAGIHRDFYSDQVIVDDKDLYIIDFDLFCEGDPGLDIGNFIGHITEQSLRVLGDPKALLDREEAMEEAFVACSGEKVRAAVKAYATLTLVRHIYISTLIKERRPFTGALIELCKDRLNITSG
ncbi:MAG: phosphotransferase, partial [Nitrospiria bacterium]